MAEETIRLAEMRQQRILVPSIVNDLDEMLAGYIRAQLLLAGLSLAVYTGVLLIMRVPYAVILGVLAGVAEFVPVVGPLVAAVSIFGVAFLSNYGFQTSFLLMAKLRAAGDYFRIADYSGVDAIFVNTRAFVGINLDADRRSVFPPLGTASEPLQGV